MQVLWRAVKVKKGLTNRYLDDLAAAVETGYIYGHISKIVIGGNLRVCAWQSLIIGGA